MQLVYAPYLLQIITPKLKFTHTKVINAMVKNICLNKILYISDND